MAVAAGLALPVPTLAGEPGGFFREVKPVVTVENRLGLALRAAGGSQDSDLYDHWLVRGSGWAGGHLDGAFSGRLHKDLDSTDRSLGSDLFVGVEDRRQGWAEQIYQLWADLHTGDGRFGLRLGRQYLENAGALQIDGGLLRFFAGDPLDGELFFGRPVSYYSTTRDDWAGGAALGARLWPGGKLRLAYVAFRDREVDARDEQLLVEAWQRLAASWQARGRLMLLDAELAMAAAEARYGALAAGFDAWLRLEHWQGLGAMGNAYSPLQATLGDLAPFTVLSARCSKVLLPWLTVSPGVSGRFVAAGNRDLHNRQYGHADLTFLFTLTPAWTLSVSGEHWDVSGHDRFQGVSGQVSYRPGGLWDLSAGTAYLDYHYTQYADTSFALRPADVVIAADNSVVQVSPDAYTLFVRLRCRLTEAVSLRIHAELEDNSLESDTIYGLRTTLITRF
ncbi:MAG: hypothetical protein AB1634_11040 [Thermodesulfobacteriota bacterium]